MARNIESPGVQISEIDLSLNGSLPIGTNVLVNGFTDQGPAQELLNVTSIGEYEQIYGVPTNAAERYSYHTMKNLLSTPAKVIFNRLPYGTTGGDGFNNKYTALLYPSYSVSNAGGPLSGVGTYYIGTPTQITISEEEYNNWKKGGLQWNPNSNNWGTTGAPELTGAEDATFIIVNKLQTSVNQDFEGFYVSLSDNKKASTTSTSEDFEFDSVLSVRTSKSHDNDGTTSNREWHVLSDSRLDFELSGNISDKPNTISEAVETIPTWDLGNEDYNDALVVGIHKFRRAGSGKEQNALQFLQYEGYVGSLGKDRKYTEPTGFQETTFFIENLMNDDSAFMDIIVNPNMSEGNWSDENGKPNKTIRILDDDGFQVLDDSFTTNRVTVKSVTSYHSFMGGGMYLQYYNIINGRPNYINYTSGHSLHYYDVDDTWKISYHDNVGGEGGWYPETKYLYEIDAGTEYFETPPPNETWRAIDEGTLLDVYSTYVELPNNNEKITDSEKPFMRSDSAFTIGLYQEELEQVKEIGDIPTKLKLGLRLAEDYEVIPLDLVLDSGLSTIHTTMKLLNEDAVVTEEFDDGKKVDITDLLDPADGKSSNVANAWMTVFNQFDIFCRDTRKDCMFIADIYRNVIIKGKNVKVLDSKARNFSQHAYTPLKNLTAGCNSSYSTTYAQWAKVYDGASSDYAWIPYSGIQGAIMARLDSKLFTWSAPAGLENGLVVGALDLALPTTQKQRDLLYRNNLNAVVFFPADGMVCWGQKTLQKKPSAFDRINVRRLFLTLEKGTRSLMKYFVFQPNTTFTRSRVVNTLTPIFDVAKHNEGVYDYLIVCDERNNTPAVIDNNELQVDIYLKPVRTAEFILVNFYATRTDQDFNELI